MPVFRLADDMMDVFPKSREDVPSNPVKRTSAADEVFNVLHDRILSGKLKTGDRLPSQERLAKQLGVSRNTVREAIYKLTVMGLLNAMQGVGTVVCQTSSTRYMASLTEHLLLQPATVREFLEARIFVERATAKLAAVRATGEDVDGMRAIVARQRTAFQTGRIDAFSRLDAEFHVALARASRNSVLERFLEVIRDLLGRFISEVSRLPDAVEKAINFHDGIIDCVHLHDEDGAEGMISRHLSDVVRNIEANVKIDLDVDRFLKTASS